MMTMTTNQQIAAVDYLAEHGWTFDIDRFDPRGDAYRGWWLHPTLRPRRAGDARKLHYAAEIAFTDAGYSIEDLTPAWAQVYA
jgi:hypothetical protein